MNNKQKHSYLIEELLSHGVKISLDIDNNGVYYKVDGFYKSGSISLYQINYEKSPHFKAISRYGEVDYIDDLCDLALLNLRWWNTSKGRFDGWRQPDSNWKSLLLKCGLIKEKINVEYVEAL